MNKKYKLIVYYLNGDKEKYITESYISPHDGMIKFKHIVDISSPRYGLEWGVDKKEAMITTIISLSSIRYINIFEV